MKVLYFRTPAEFRAWLEEHHAEADELWVGFHKRGTGKASLTWPESVDEALCFGWIDGVRKSVDAARYKIRFTPRRPGSIWSTVNIARARLLIEAGRMRPPGLQAFERRREDLARRYSFEQGEVRLDEDSERALRANPKAWKFFNAQPPGYRKLVSWWVLSAKKEETRRRRLARLVADSARGERIGLLRRAEP